MKKWHSWLLIIFLSAVVILLVRAWQNGNVPFPIVVIPAIWLLQGIGAIFNIKILSYQAYSNPLVDYADLRAKKQTNRKNTNTQRNSKGNPDDTFIIAMAWVLATFCASIVWVFYLNDNIDRDWWLGSSDNKSQKNKSPKATTKARPNPRKSPAYDPAVDIKGQVYFYADNRFTNLNTSDYKRAAGDLARIQNRLLKNKRQSKTYPTVLVGNGSWENEKCNESIPTLGLYQYGSECNQLITINFTADNLSYEHQIEVLTTLAHEWGHHLINISGEQVSDINNELLSDCFAGIYLAYLDKYDAITGHELESTVKFMGQIGNTHGTGIHGTPAQRRNGLIAGALYASDSRKSDGKKMWNAFCKGLDNVINLDKGLP